METQLLICVTGASGSIYAEKLFEVCRKNNIKFDLIASEYGKSVYKYEIGKNLSCESSGAEHIFLNSDMYNRAASGSNPYKAVIVIPSSMGTIGKAASGVTENLINRAIDVGLKEEKKVVICFRETPLNGIHLKNLSTLKDNGCSIFPLSPSFYFNQSSVDEVVINLIYRLLSLVGYDLDEKKRWS
ncbi:MAG: aromatic acid decarboxylase [Candidatus Delongbacteria bacterium]|nr:MAG: aromatic acid decarboxylase [Candidatus Delongbacteria bacterium]